MLPGKPVPVQAVSVSHRGATRLTPEQVVQRQLEAYNAHDLEGFVRTFGDDVLVYRPPGIEPAIAGKDALRTFYATQRFCHPRLRADLMHRIVLGNRILDHERIHGLEDQPIEMVMVYEVSDSLIRTAWAFARTVGSE